MTTNYKYSKTNIATTYDYAFGVLLELPNDNNLKQFISRLESEGRNEKSICYAITRTCEKINQFKHNPNFWSIMYNEINKYSWASGDPRWETRSIQRRKHY